MMAARVSITTFEKATMVLTARIVDNTNFKIEQCEIKLKVYDLPSLPCSLQSLVMRVLYLLYGSKRCMAPLCCSYKPLYIFSLYFVILIQVYICLLDIFDSVRNGAAMDTLGHPVD